MSALRWLLGFILSVLIFGCGNFLQQVGINFLFESTNYWVASGVSIIIVLVATNRIAQYAFFIVPYTVVKVTSMSLYYFFLFSLVLSILMQAVRNDFHLDNSIPKWVHIMISFLFFTTTYSLKRYIQHVSQLNDTYFSEKWMD